MTVVTDINELKEKQRRALEAARHAKERAEANGGLTGEVLTTINNAMDEHDELGRQIRTLERVEGIDPARRMIAESQDDDGEAETVPMDTRSGREEDEEDVREDEGLDPYNVRWDERRTTRGFRDMSVVEERAYLRAAQTTTYNRAFWASMRRRGYTKAHVDELEKMRTMVEGIDADGGYLAPTQLVAGIIRESLEYEQLKPRMEVIRANARSLTYMKGLDSIVMGWVPELGTKPEDQVSFAPFTLVPHVGAVIVWISDELLEDETFGLQSYLQGLVAEAKVLLEEEAFISGSGSGRPFGILTRLNSLSGTPQRYTTAAANAFTSADARRLPYDLTPRFRQRAVWILGTLAIRSIALEREGVGTGQYLWQPSAVAGQPDTLNGKPVIETDAVALNSPISTGNDIGIFGDLKRYRVFERLGLQVKRLEELRALTDEVGFRFRFRTGGDVMLNEAFKTIRVQ